MSLPTQSRRGRVGALYVLRPLPPYRRPTGLLNRACAAGPFGGKSHRCAQLPWGRCCGFVLTSAPPPTAHTPTPHTHLTPHTSPTHAPPCALHSLAVEQEQMLRSELINALSKGTCYAGTGNLMTLYDAALMRQSL